MAMACYDAGVEYLGLDMEESVIVPARCRLGAYVMYTKLLDRQPVQMRLGTEPQGPREVDAIAGVLALSNAALLPAGNVPREHSSEIAFQVFGYLTKEYAADAVGEALAVHAQHCQCNVDPVNLIIAEVQPECLHLMVKPSKLLVVLYFLQNFTKFPFRCLDNPSAKG